MKSTLFKSKHKKTFTFIFCLLLSFVVGSVLTYSVLQFGAKENTKDYEEVVLDKDSQIEDNSVAIKPVTKTEPQEKVTLITQAGFDDWVRKISKTLIPDYQLDLDLSNLGNSARAMNKELSFDKREILTSDGNISVGVDMSTEKTITYVSGTKYFTVSFMRNENNITDDFQGSDWLYSTQENVYCVPLIMTYKNMIILMTLQDTTTPVDYVEAIELSKLIVGKLEYSE